MWNDNYWHTNYWEDDYWLEGAGTGTPAVEEDFGMIGDLTSDIMLPLITDVCNP